MPSIVEQGASSPAGLRRGLSTRLECAVRRDGVLVRAGVLPAGVIATKPALTYVAQQTTVHAFLTGLRPGTSLHLFFAPGGCNVSAVTDVIIPDFLPPTFTDLERLDEAAATAVSSATLEVRWTVRQCCAAVACRRARVG